MTTNCVIRVPLTAMVGHDVTLSTCVHFEKPIVLGSHSHGIFPWCGRDLATSCAIPFIQI